MFEILYGKNQFTISYTWKWQDSRETSFILMLFVCFLKQCLCDVTQTVRAQLAFLKTVKLRLLKGYKKKMKT